MSTLALVLIIVLLLAMAGVFPGLVHPATTNWGYGPSSLLLVLVIVVIVLIVAGRL